MSLVTCYCYTSIYFQQYWEHPEIPSFWLLVINLSLELGNYSQKCWLVYPDIWLLAPEGGQNVNSFINQISILRKKQHGLIFL